MTPRLLLACAALFSFSSVAAAAEDGAAVFAQFCVTCHGTGGQGDGPAGASLNPTPADFTKAEFWETRDSAHVKKVVTGGGASIGKSPMMPAWGPVLSEAQIEAVAGHVESFKPAGDAPAEPKPAPATP